jgi:hypothetical protein
MSGLITAAPLVVCVQPPCVVFKQCAHNVHAALVGRYLRYRAPCRTDVVEEYKHSVGDLVRGLFGSSMERKVGRQDLWGRRGGEDRQALVWDASCSRWLSGSGDGGLGTGGTRQVERAFDAVSWEARFLPLMPIDFETFAAARRDKAARIDEGLQGLSAGLAGKKSAIVKLETTSTALKKAEPWVGENSEWAASFGRCKLRHPWDLMYRYGMTPRVIIDPGATIGVAAGVHVARAESHLRYSACFVKGLPLQDRAGKLVELANSVMTGEPPLERAREWWSGLTLRQIQRAVVLLGFDGKAWDGSLGVPLLELEREIFKAVFGAPFTRAWHDTKDFKRAFTSLCSLVKAKWRGCRISGHPWTSFGNGVLNVMLQVQSLGRAGVSARNIAMYLDGVPVAGWGSGEIMATISIEGDDAALLLRSGLITPTFTHVYTAAMASTGVEPEMCGPGVPFWLEGQDELPPDFCAGRVAVVGGRPLWIPVMKRAIGKGVTFTVSPRDDFTSKMRMRALSMGATAAHVPLLRGLSIAMQHRYGRGCIRTREFNHDVLHGLGGLSQDDAKAAVFKADRRNEEKTGHWRNAAAQEVALRPMVALDLGITMVQLARAETAIEEYGDTGEMPMEFWATAFAWQYSAADLAHDGVAATEEVVNVSKKEFGRFAATGSVDGALAGSKRARGPAGKAREGKIVNTQGRVRGRVVASSAAGVGGRTGSGKRTPLSAVAGIGRAAASWVTRVVSRISHD